MKTSNIVLLFDLLISLTGRVQEIQALLKTAQAEERDVTEAEIDALVADDDRARGALNAAIAAAKASGG